MKSRTMNELWLAVCEVVWSDTPYGDATVRPTHAILGGNVTWRPDLDVFGHPLAEPALASSYRLHVATGAGVGYGYYAEADPQGTHWRFADPYKLQGYLPDEHHRLSDVLGSCESLFL